MKNIKSADTKESVGGFLFIEYFIFMVGKKGHLWYDK